MLQQLYYRAVVKVEWSFDVCLLILCIGKTANSSVFVVLKHAWEGRMTQL